MLRVTHCSQRSNQVDNATKTIVIYLDCTRLVLINICGIYVIFLNQINLSISKKLKVKINYFSCILFHQYIKLIDIYQLLYIILVFSDYLILLMIYIILIYMINFYMLYIDVVLLILLLYFYYCLYYSHILYANMYTAGWLG